MLACELRLPEEKLLHLKAHLEEWGDRKACQLKKLESLVGLLNHACKVVRSGRSFLRRMIDLLHSMPDSSRSNHPIRLNREFRSALAWWRSFVSGWNGKSFLPQPNGFRQWRWPPMHPAHGGAGFGMAPTGFRCIGTTGLPTLPSWSRS